MRDLQLSRQNTTAIRGTLLHGMLETTFDCASGTVDFAPQFNIININTNIQQQQPYGLTNRLSQQQPQQQHKSATLGSLPSTFMSPSVLASMLPVGTRDNSTDGWTKKPDTAIVYRDGTIDEPDDYREFVNENFLSRGVRIMGLLLMSIAWLLAFAGLIALQIFTKDPVVQRAQPFFLKMLCYGSIIMSSAIFTLSWDEGAGWSDAQLDVARTLTPWFFFVGHIVTFCALFTKLWRVDKVLLFRRRTVTISNVMKPSIVLLAISISILSAWTIVDPWTWVRKITSDLPAERYGQCTSTYFGAWFGPLVVLLFVAEILTMYFAWKTADIPNDFRDSGAVIYSSFAQIQSWAIGVPMLAVLGTSSSDGTYFGRIFLIWIFAVSSVVVVVGPKLIHAYRIRRNPELGRAKSRVHVSGLTGPSPQSSHFMSTNTGSENFRSQPRSVSPEGPLSRTNSQ